MKPDPQRRVLVVRCPVCKGIIRREVTDCFRVAETCLTCTYRLSGPNQARPPQCKSKIHGQ